MHRIHLGEVQRRGTEILGDAVNIPSCVDPIAEPEGECLSARVYDQVPSKVPPEFESLGPKRLKGVQDTIEVYRAYFRGVLPRLLRESTPSVCPQGVTIPNRPPHLSKPS
jgi:class 3 adenylate cyclase